MEVWIIGVSDAVNEEGRGRMYRAKEGWANKKVYLGSRVLCLDPIWAAMSGDNP